MHVRLYNVRVEQIIEGSYVGFSVHLEYKLNLHFTFLWTLFLNEPVEIHIELIGMIVF